jgi:hypothetical protein
MRGAAGEAWAKQDEKPDAMHHSEFRVGGVSVRLAGQCSHDVTLVPSLEPFRAKVAISDISIRVEWADSLNPPAGRKVFDSGSVWRLHEDQAGLCFDFNAPTLGDGPYKRLLVDRNFLEASLQMNEQCFAASGNFAAPLEYPLDELLIVHRLTQENAVELHACGIVGADGTGNLFVGHSGAGKSTTTRLWTASEDVEVLSDDRIIVRRDEDTSETPCGATGDAEKQKVLRPNDCSASPTAHSAQDDTGKTKVTIQMYGTPWHGEAEYASPERAPLARIFILEHGHGNVIRPLPASKAVAELFARSFVPFHRHEYVESALEFLEEVVEAVPCYRYAFEPNRAAVERIREFSD